MASWWGCGGNVMPFLEGLGQFDVQSLGLIQRIMLATDGTLTDTVEAIFNEPIGLNKLSVSITATQAPIHALSLQAGEQIMERKVLIFGETTGRTYVYAESVLAVSRLPEAFHSALLTSNEPLGRLWLRHKLETWKELLSVNVGSLHSGDFFFSPNDSSDLLTRTYRLLSGGQPLMLITEYFPTAYAEHSVAVVDGGLVFS